MISKFGQWLLGFVHEHEPVHAEEKIKATNVKANQLEMLLYKADHSRFCFKNLYIHIHFLESIL